MNLTFIQFFQYLNKKNRLTLLSILFLAMFLHAFDLYLEDFPNLDPIHLGINVALFILYIFILGMILSIPTSYQPRENVNHEMDSDKIETEIETADNNPSTDQPIEVIDEALMPCLATQMQAAFKEWKLTTAEQKVASMLILGHSLKEIAENCHRGEGTVRQHATIIYKKAQLSGRAKLTGYFLQDLINTDKLLMPAEKPVQADTDITINTNDSE